MPGHLARHELDAGLAGGLPGGHVEAEGRVDALDVRGDDAPAVDDHRRGGEGLTHAISLTDPNSPERPEHARVGRSGCGRAADLHSGSCGYTAQPSQNPSLRVSGWFPLRVGLKETPWPNRSNAPFGQTERSVRV